MQNNPLSIVYNEDNIEVMKRFEANFFDLAIVDPPYGINAPNMTMGSNPNRKGRDSMGEIQYGSTSVAQRLKKGRLNTGSGKLKNRALNTMNCDWDSQRPSPEYFNELFRVSKNQIIWGGAITLIFRPLGVLLCGIKTNHGKTSLKQNTRGHLLISPPSFSHILIAGETMRIGKFIRHRNPIISTITANIISRIQAIKFLILT